MVLLVKDPPANARDAETQVGSLGWENPLEEGMATHSSILAWRTTWKQRSLAAYSPQSYKELDTTEATLHTSICQH